MKKNLTVLITAGPTQELIDPVRYLSNHSSGKMGYALASAFNKKAKVILISGPTTLPPPTVNQFISVVTAEEMLSAVLKEIKKVDIFIACAAVADYRPLRFHSKKIKKHQACFLLKLERTPDILKTVSHLPRKPILVGFCAETQKLIGNAQKKLKEKKLDYVIANRIHRNGAPFHSDRNTVTLLHKNGKKIHLSKDTKLHLAHKIADILLNKNSCLSK